MSKLAEAWANLKERVHNDISEIAFGVGTVAAFGIALTHPAQEATYKATTVIEQVNSGFAHYQSQATHAAFEWTESNVVNPMLNHLLPNPLDGKQQ